MAGRINRVCRDLTTWGNKCGLKFNPSKTIVILFTKSNKTKKQYNGAKLVKMDDKYIPFTDTVKYLGVTLDTSLNWKHHIMDKVSTCKKLLITLNSKLIGMQAPKPKLSKWAYTGVIRPKLLYACMIWGNAINTVKQLKALKGLDRLATRSTTTISRKTPQASIELMIDLIPIELMIQKTGISTYIRLKQQLEQHTRSSHPKFKPHLSYWEQQICDLNTTTTHTDKCAAKVWEKHYNVNMESINGKSKHRQHSEYTIYTDGSKKREGTGGGFVVHHKKNPIHTQSFQLEDYTTVYQAELEAIYQACNYMEENFENLKPKFVKILTDSQAALITLNNIDFTSSTALKTAEALENIAWRVKGCTIAWLRAHIGTEGNEAADEAAKKGAENKEAIHKKLTLPPPPNIIRSSLDEAIRKRWEHIWRSSNQYRHTKYFYSKPDKNKAHKINNLSRSHLSKLITLITCLLYTSPSPRDRQKSRMPSSA